MRTMLTSLALLLCLTGLSFAQSSTVTYDDGQDGIGYRAGIRRVLIDWTSDASGDVVITTRKVVGTLIKAVTDPSATAPTDDYDIVVTDAEGINVLTASQLNLTNRDTTNSEEAYFLVKDAAGTPLAQSVHPVVCDVLTITVAAAGNAKSGQLILYYRP